MRTLAGFCLIVVCTVASHAIAATTTVYKCTAKDGSISFQDQPCPAQKTERRIEMPAPPPPPADADASANPEPEPEPPPHPREPPIEPPSKPAIRPPAFYLCTRYDGSRYISDTGRGSSTAVPLGGVGIPQQDLAHAYGPGGIGVSAPGLREIPHSKAPIASTYQWVDDECHFAAPREACAFLRDRLDDVEDRLKRAFSDTETQLRQEQTQLRDKMRGC